MIDGFADWSRFERLKNGFCALAGLSPDERRQAAERDAGFVARALSTDEGKGRDGEPRPLPLRAIHGAARERARLNSSYLYRGQIRCPSGQRRCP